MSTKNRRRGSDYIVQGGILAAASILVRVIGLAYRIPVTRILGPVGNSYYSEIGRASCRERVYVSV